MVTMYKCSLCESTTDEELKAVAIAEVQKYDWTRVIVVRIDTP